ncbi:MAG: AIR synthase-related protein, partial [Helicobacter sp.]|nr:AIR synthase-related protein [Helicobacter sp.]
QKLCEDRIYGQVPRIDLHTESRLWDFLYETIHQGDILSAKNLNQGGLAIALAKMALLGNKGIRVQTGYTNWQLLFAQTPSCVVIEVVASKVEKILSQIKTYKLQAQNLGVVMGQRICIDSIDMSLHEAKKLYFESFAKISTL